MKKDGTWQKKKGKIIGGFEEIEIWNHGLSQQQPGFVSGLSSRITLVILTQHWNKDLGSWGTLYARRWLMMSGPIWKTTAQFLRGNFHEIKNKLHTDIVSKAVSRSDPNRVLGRRRPPVHSNVNHLPRVIRVTLDQLRSGQDWQDYAIFS